MLYDWRSLDSAPPEAVCFDAGTGEFVPLVFYYDTVFHIVGRYQLSPDGKVVVIDRATQHPAEIWDIRRLRLLWVAGPPPVGGCAGDHSA